MLGFMTGAEGSDDMGQSAGRELNIPNGVSAGLALVALTITLCLLTRLPWPGKTAGGAKEGVDGRRMATSASSAMCCRCGSIERPNSLSRMRRPSR
jgi:hypothetical protein